MLSGLETISLKLSDACYENSTFRLDSEYFKKEYLSLAKSIIPISQKMKNFLLFGHYGILPKSEDYTNEGLPLLRGKDLRTGLLNVNDLVKVPHFYFDEKHSVQKDDIFILAKGATIGESDGVLLIHKDMGDIIFNGSCFKVRLNDKINRYFMFIFMMTKYFTFQKSRAVANNGIEYNSIETIRDYMIPQLSFEFQYAIESMARKIIGYSEESEHLYQQAEKILLTEIGLSGYEDKTISIKTFQEAFNLASRMDAEYYLPKFAPIVAAIKRQNYKSLKMIAEIKKSIEPGSDVYCDNGVPFVRVADLGKHGITAPTKHLDAKIYDEYLSFLAPRKDTILLSKDGSVGIAYKVEKDLPMITSGAVLHLIVRCPEEVLPDYLTLVLNSLPVQAQAERDSGGAIIQHWRPDDIKKTLIPILPIVIQRSIVAQVKKSFACLAEADRLLQSAKQAVEIAIENGENKAMEFIEKNV